jgi:hypothetical protein
MRRTVRQPLLILLVALLAMSLAVPALGATEGEEGEEGAEVTSTTVSSGLTPAVEMESEASEPAQPDWTYRYLIPTGLALAGIIIVLTAIKYFTDVVRKRYRIVE